MSVGGYGMWTKMIAVGLLLFTFGCKTDRCVCKGDIIDPLICAEIDKHVAPDIKYTVTTHTYETKKGESGIFFNLESPDIDSASGYGHYEPRYIMFDGQRRKINLFVVDNMGTAIEDDEFIKAGVPERFWKP